MINPEIARRIINKNTARKLAPIVAAGAVALGGGRANANEAPNFFCESVTQMRGVPVTDPKQEVRVFSNDNPETLGIVGNCTDTKTVSEIHLSVPPEKKGNDIVEWTQVGRGDNSRWYIRVIHQRSSNNQ